MHKEILSDKQLELLPVMAGFRKEYYLVEGTAIALYLGHRPSIDFDMFKSSAINHKKNLDRLTETGFPCTVTRRVTEQMNLIERCQNHVLPIPLPRAAHREVWATFPPAISTATCGHESLCVRTPFKVERLC